ncbi:helix-turn-helix transcriptional regulator [Novilysobacter avium]|uniref:WYL domain-containing protein n=1 Tax=Novilysobacter avium TaxID=2781023 RepID=A0A7S6ZU85_9GAMM|nr:WYL domain-containing protein [Lysobacter avium]QOW21783.1 WYL domain-containing protein [Lysobacter avium]
MKADSTKTLQRLLAMLQMIPRAPRRADAAQLRARLSDHGFEVTARTVQRDLQALSGRFPIQIDDREKPFGWSWDPNARPALMPGLSPAQAVAILLARTHLHGLLPRVLTEELGTIEELARETLDRSGWSHWHQQTAVVPTHLRLELPRVAPKILEGVQKVLVSKRRAQLDYRSKWAQENREFIVSPLGLLSRGGLLYLVAVVEGYEDPRQFALHRISGVAALLGEAAKPEGFDFHRYARRQGSVFLSRGKVRLVLRIDGPAATHLGEQKLSPDQVVVRLDGTHQVEVSATVEDDETLRWWLLSFGSQLEVVHPSVLRDWLKNEMMEALRRYR